MSITIEKAGILDTLQDAGRFGFAHLGVNPNGPMDWQSHQLANALVGNDLKETIIESHFPAPLLNIKNSCIMAFAGADFHAQLNGNYLPINKTLFIPANSVIQFAKKFSGERLHIAVHGGFEIEKVMGSAATNMKGSFGGWQGRPLRKGDQIPIRPLHQKTILQLQIMPWFVYPDVSTGNAIRVMPGPEWAWLTDASKENILNTSFVIQPQSDRMAIKLQGQSLELHSPQEMISSAVQMGTVQLLPNGQLLVLMADHQTVGGYPRILQIINADLPKLAQMGALMHIAISIISLQEAINAFHEMQAKLLRISGAIRMQLTLK